VKLPKRPSARAERRAAERALDKLTHDRERLARMEPGGTPEHPIDVVSASLVDVRAKALRCPRCDVPMQLEDHTAETVEGARLRVARLKCARCGATRTAYFRVASAMPN
jgi:ribosomal protein S27AE